METSTLNGALFADMIRGGAQKLNNNRTLVNDLNVFPVPDGDTGDNMYMTIDSGSAALNGEKADSLEHASSCVAKGMLLGARGNSGVILSRIFAGIARGFLGAHSADVGLLANAFSNGVEEAYSAVSQPVEGTILTVYKEAVSFANSKMNESSTIDSYFTDFTAELKRSLERTPEKLAVLKDAGVVDSGGAGFVYIAEGMKDVLNGVRISYDNRDAVPTARRIDFSLFTEDSELEYGYCTEFLLRLQNKKTDISQFDTDAFRMYLEQHGNSVVAFKDGSIIKAHIHTQDPGKILSYCRDFGEFLTVKIENMALQHNEIEAQKDYIPKVEKSRKKYGIVCVAAGSGIKSTFSSLGADIVVDGGQSMNPSAENLIEAFERVNAETIIVFPNNKNIILTAKQAAELYDKSDVIIINTKTIGEGYAALSMLDTSSDDNGIIEAELNEAAQNVVTGMVSRATRTTKKDGVDIVKDDYIGFTEDRVYTDSLCRKQAVTDLAKRLNAQNYDIMLLVCGTQTNEEEVNELYKTLCDEYKKTEIITIDGGQPVYDYIMILE
ncbi:MAG: DAK2 domain-containing protein [Clostridiales bacterium]|nr:DAK2 domain-containing protein [Clostridiales bacterium]